MAIYHFTVKVISRGKGQSVVASAAYRAASKLFDERLAKHHDYRNKPNVVLSEIMLPKDAPKRFLLREMLWNEIERIEVRADAQLAREIEFALPIELTQEQAITLARKFINEQFVSKGMIADWNVHWEEHNPHVHVMLSLREVNEHEFGNKVREWNKKELLQSWREQWAEYANAYLEKYQHDAQIDSRSYEAQGVDLIPTTHLGKNVIEMSRRNISTDILKEDKKIKKENIERITEKPERLFGFFKKQDVITISTLSKIIARYFIGTTTKTSIVKITKALEQYDAVFYEPQLSKSMVYGDIKPENFNKVLKKLKTSLVYLGKSSDGQSRYTSRHILAIEKDIHRKTNQLLKRRQMYISKSKRKKILDKFEKKHQKKLSLEQRIAAMYVTNDKAITCLVGKAGTGKSFLFKAIKEIWEAKGLKVQGVASLGIAADRLQKDTGIPTRTIESFRYSVKNRSIQLTSKDVIVLDEAGITDSPSLQFVLKAVKEANAKLILVGDPQQLQPVGPGAIFRTVLDKVGFVSLEQVYRQQKIWQREATHYFSKKNIASGLKAYQKRDFISLEKSQKLIKKLVADWQKMYDENQHAEQLLILAHRNKDVDRINKAIREKLIESKHITEGTKIETSKGEIKISENERILFLKNNKTLNVRNGQFGTITLIEKNKQNEISKITVQLDGNKKQITFSPKDYAYFNHGYAATIHKSQGITVDNSFVYVAGKRWDSHLIYVAMSRHKDNCYLYVDKSNYRNLNDLEIQLMESKQKENALDFINKYAQQRGIKNNLNAIAKEIKQLEKYVKESENQPYAYLKRAAKDAFEKYIEQLAKDKSIFKYLNKDAAKIHQRIKTILNKYDERTL